MHKKTFARFALIASLMLGSALEVAAQATLNQTTLSAGVTRTAGVVQVTSASTMAAGDILYVDREAMAIRAVSGTTITVSRGREGTLATAHATRAVVYSGVPTRFYNSDPPYGRCTASAQPVLPYINVVTGGIFSCRLSGTINTATSSTDPGLWGGTQLFVHAPSVLPRRIVQDADYTMTPDDVVIAFTSIGSAATRTVTLPAATGMPGKIIYIQDESGQMSAGVNSIFATGTINLVIGTTLTAGTGVISTNFGIIRLRAGCATPNGVVNSCSWYSW